MFSKKFYKMFGLRIKLGMLGIGTMYFWDEETQNLVPAHTYCILCMYAGVAVGGHYFSIIHMIQMYLKTHNFEIDDEVPHTANAADLRNFATLIIEVGEVLASTTISGLLLVFLERQDVFRYLMNQLLDYNKKVSEMIKAGKLVLSEDQKKIVLLGESLVYMVMLGSMLVPFGVAAACLAKVEPTNQIINEWLEVRFEFTWVWLPLIWLLTEATYSIGSTICLLANAIIMFYMTFTVITDALTPEDYKSTPTVGPGRCKLITRNFDTIEDEEAMNLYRVQQLLNTLLNTFFKSPKVAFHHVGALATFVALLVFAIRFNRVLDEIGPIAYVVVFSSMFVPFIIIYYQTNMSGKVVGASDDFRSSAKQIMTRRFMFRKFTKSLPCFYIQVAYPFYTVDKDTFVSFLEQAQDYTINLLLY